MLRNCKRFGELLQLHFSLFQLAVQMFHGTLATLQCWLEIAKSALRYIPYSVYLDAHARVLL